MCVLTNSATPSQTPDLESQSAWAQNTVLRKLYQENSTYLTPVLIRLVTLWDILL